MLATDAPTVVSLSSSADVSDFVKAAKLLVQSGIACIRPRCVIVFISPDGSLAMAGRQSAS